MRLAAVALGLSLAFFAVSVESALPCDASPCQHGGTCTQVTNTTYNCTCVPGFNGTNCQNDYEQCSSNPCLNGGTCTNLLNSFQCSCLPGFNGTTCQNDYEHCSSNPCLNGGTCTNMLNSFKCSCPYGFDGLTCAASTCNSGSISTSCLISNATAMAALFPCTAAPAGSTSISTVCAYQGSGSVSITGVSYDFRAGAEMQLVVPSATQIISINNSMLSATQFNISAGALVLSGAILNASARSIVTQSSTAAGASNVGEGGRVDKLCFNSDSAADVQTLERPRLASTALQIGCQQFLGMGQGGGPAGGGCVFVEGTSALVIEEGSQLLADGAPSSSVNAGGGSGGSVIVRGPSAFTLSTSCSLSAGGGAGQNQLLSSAGGGGGGAIIITQSSLPPTTAVSGGTGLALNDIVGVANVSGGGLTPSSHTIQASTGCVCGGAGVLSVCSVADNGACRVVVDNRQLQQSGACTVTGATPAVRAAVTSTAAGLGSFLPAASINGSSGATVSASSLELVASLPSAAPQFIAFRNAFLTGIISSLSSSSSFTAAAGVASIAIAGNGGDVAFIGSTLTRPAAALTAANISGASISFTDLSAVVIDAVVLEPQTAFSTDGTSSLSLKQCLTVSSPPLAGVAVDIAGNITVDGTLDTAFQAWCVSAPWMFVDAADVNVEGVIDVATPSSDVCSQAIASFQDCSSFTVSSSSSVAAGAKYGVVVGARAGMVTLSESAHLSVAASLFCGFTGVSIDGTVFSSGLGCAAENGPGAGSQRSGAGHHGVGGDSGVANGGSAYDGTGLAPAQTGSGGGKSTLAAGGAGGGVINVGAQSGIIAIGGVLNASGETVGFGSLVSLAAGGGSGGTILLAGQDLMGSGTVSVAGGDSLAPALGTTGGGGGGGFVALQWLNHTAGYGRQWTGTMPVSGGSGYDHGGSGLITSQGCVPGTESIFCDKCSPGQYSISTESLQVGCQNCLAGFFSASSGATTCHQCPGGYYMNSPGASTCDICAVGTYSASPTAAAYCKSCVNKPENAEYYQAGEKNSKCSFSCLSGFAGFECEQCPISNTNFEVCSGNGVCVGNGLDPYNVTVNAIHVNCNDSTSSQYVCGNCSCAPGYVDTICITQLQRIIQSLGGPLGFSLIVVAVVVVIGMIPVLCCNIKSCPGYRKKTDTSNLSRQGSHLALVKVNTLEYSLLNGRSAGQMMTGSAIEKYVVRLYCTGNNTPDAPLQLAVEPADARLAAIVTRAGFRQFAEDFNKLAQFSRRQRTMYCFLRMLPPLGELYVASIRKRRCAELLRYVQRHNHNFFRSSRVQHIKNSLFAAASEDSSLFFVDVADIEAAPDEKYAYCRRGPLLVPFAGEGTYFSPFFLDPNDILIKSIPEAATHMGSEKFIDQQWCDFVQDLNVALRVVDVCALPLRKNQSMEKVMQFVSDFRDLCRRKAHLGGISIRLVALKNEEYFSAAGRQYLDFGAFSCPMKQRKSKEYHPRAVTVGALGSTRENVSVANVPVSFTDDENSRRSSDDFDAMDTVAPGHDSEIDNSGTWRSKNHQQHHGVEHDEDPDATADVLLFYGDRLGIEVQWPSSVSMAAGEADVGLERNGSYESEAADSHRHGMRDDGTDSSDGSDMDSGDDEYTLDSEKGPAIAGQSGSAGRRNRITSVAKRSIREQALYGSSSREVDRSTVGPLWASLNAGDMLRSTNSNNSSLDPSQLGAESGDVSGKAASGNLRAKMGRSASSQSLDGEGGRVDTHRWGTSTTAGSKHAPVAAVSQFRRVILSRGAIGSCISGHERSLGRARYTCLRNVSNPSTCTQWASPLLFSAVMFLLVIESAGKFVLAVELACFQFFQQNCLISASFMVYILVLPSLPIVEPVTSFSALLVRRPQLMRISSVLAVMSMVNPIVMMVVLLLETQVDFSRGGGAASTAESFSTTWPIFFGIPVLLVIIRICRIFLMQKYFAAIESAPVSSWQSLLYISKLSKDLD
eukprot:INCI10162.2.p1 GENE.INCI10162.2~~INCI10162.2.p1  ORF type:complete len:1966 (-),score=295.66 INCI10162.2:62-5959(-)